VTPPDVWQAKPSRTHTRTWIETSKTVSATDGLLAIDRNGNGSIDNITELFGTETQDGFQVLSTLDSNADGRIDAADTAWSTLRLWVDGNSNGRTDAGELHQLSDYDVTSLSLQTTPTPDLTIAGNAVVATSTFTRGDGSTGSVGAVFFDTIPSETLWVRPDGFQASALATALPQLGGRGTIAGSAVVLTNSPTLAITLFWPRRIAIANSTYG
jgi:hypothetical protein